MGEGRGGGDGNRRRSEAPFTPAFSPVGVICRIPHLRMQGGLDQDKSVAASWVGLGLPWSPMSPEEIEPRRRHEPLARLQLADLRVKGFDPLRLLERALQAEGQILPDRL
jgi:hypothetical protein